MSELIRALAAFAEVPGPEHARIAQALGLERAPTRAQHTELFLFQLYPYASVYLGPEGMLGGEGRDRVAGFWRALELVPPPEPDHLAALLGLYATLKEGGEGASSVQGRAGADAARRALLHEHVASWVFAWLGRVADVAPAPYRAWAEILEEVLLAEVREDAGSVEAPSGALARAAARAGADTPAGAGGPGRLPIHLREAPPLSDPRDGEGDFLAELLAPVRSGMILTRTDLVRAGRVLGLGVRVGERRYTLEGFFGQDPAAALGWLAAEAADRARRHGRLERELGPAGTFWRERAERAAGLLEELAGTATTPTAETAPATAPEETHA